MSVYTSIIPNCPNVETIQNVHQLVKRPTKYGAFIQWDIILKTC